MSWDQTAFVSAYIASGLSPDSARSYCTYLRRADGVAGGLDQLVERLGREEAIQALENHPTASWGSAKKRGDSLSAVRWYCRKMLHLKDVPRYHINVFWSNEDARWIADVPDLGFCSTDGATPEEAVREMQVVIPLYLESCRAHGDPIPEARYSPAIYAARAERAASRAVEAGKIARGTTP